MDIIEIMFFGVFGIISSIKYFLKIGLVRLTENAKELCLSMK